MDSSALRGRTVLVVGEYRQTVTVVRSLARAGMRITFASPDPESPTTLSRGVSRWAFLDWNTAEQFCDQVEALLRSDPHDLVFLVGETPLRRFLTQPARLEPLCTWVQPSTRAIRECFDKSALYALAPRARVPALPWMPFRGPDAWRRGAAAMGYPVVVKRTDSSASVQGRKALICRAPSELDAFLAALPRVPNPEELLLQKFQRGIRHNCHVAACRGRLLAYFQQKVLRTDRLDDTGIGTAGASVAVDPVLRGHCEALVRALGYDGIGCVQFLVDEQTGEAGLLEFNARMDSTAALPLRLGYDYPLMAAQIALHGRGEAPLPAPCTATYALGETYHWLLGDLWSWITAARSAALPRRELARWAAASAWLALTSHHLTFDWRDPKPTLRMYRNDFFRRILARFRPARHAQVGTAN